MKVALSLADFAIGITLKQVFEKDCITWNSNTKPIYDLLDEYKPDIIFIDIANITPIFVEAVSEYKTKLVIFGSGVPDGLEPEIVCAKASTSSFIRRHIEDSAKTVLYQKDYANIPFEINPEKFSRRKVGHISISEDNEIVRSKIEAMSDIKLSKSIVGTRIGVEYYLGTIALEDMHSYIAANDIYVDFDNLFFLDCAALGKYVITHKANALFSLFSVDSLGEKCNNIVKQPQYIEEAKEAQLKVWEGDTCYHRVVEVLEALGASEVEVARKLLKDRKRCALEL